MGRDYNALWIPKTDTRGRTRDDRVYQASLRVYEQKAIPITRERLGDPSYAATLMEETVYAISDWVRRNGLKDKKGQDILNLDDYVIAVFLYSLSQFAKTRIESHCSSLSDCPPNLIIDSGLHSNIIDIIQGRDIYESLPDHIVALFEMRGLKYKWKVIAKELNTTADNAKSQYCYWRRKIAGEYGFPKPEVKKKVKCERRKSATQKW